VTRCSAPGSSPGAPRSSKAHRSRGTQRRRYTASRPGRLAQLGEHQLDKLGVTGSSPVPPIHESPASRGFHSCSPKLAWAPAGRMGTEWAQRHPQFASSNHAGRQGSRITEGLASTHLTKLLASQAEGRGFEPLRPRLTFKPKVPRLWGFRALWADYVVPHRTAGERMYRVATGPRAGAQGVALCHVRTVRRGPVDGAASRAFS
jgi:hypothetical protein